MLKDCITKDTSVFILDVPELIEYNTEEESKFNRIAETISQETGVPKKLIYQNPYFFYIDHWHKIGDKWYYFKNEEYDFNLINELLGEVISKYFDLDTISYQLAELRVNGHKKEFGILSENFCDPELIYKRAWDYDFYPFQNMNILEELRRICKSDNEYKKLLDDIKRFFIRDLYTSQLDRSGNNFLFKETQDGIRLAPLYDYADSFQSVDCGIYRNQIGELNLRNNETRILLFSDDRFQELLNLMMNAKISLFIEQVEDKHKIHVPDDLKKHYSLRESDLKKIIKDYKLLR